MKLGIVGGGRAAWAFGYAWRSLGRPLAGLAVRSRTDAARLLEAPIRHLIDVVEQSDVVLVAVTDSALADIAPQVTSAVGARTLLFHPSGAETSELFAPHPLRFSLHPLMSLPPVGTSPVFQGTLFTFEGNAAARIFAQEFVEALGGRFAEVPAEGKLRYHAAAVFASNYVEAVLEIARELIHESGIQIDVSEELAKLALSAIENWQRNEFTGPVARGDRSLIERHLRALSDDPKRVELYRLLAAELSKALQRKGF